MAIQAIILTTVATHIIMAPQSRSVSDTAGDITVGIAAAIMVDITVGTTGDITAAAILAVAGTPVVVVVVITRRTAKG